MRYSDTHKSETRARIVKNAAAAFRKYGVDGIGVAALMKKSGLTHGGFYAHFESKDALVGEAIDAAFEQSLASLADSVETAEPKQRRDVLMSRYLSDAHRDQPANGCVFAAMGSEAGRLKPALRARFDAHFETMISLLTQGSDNAEARRAAIARYTAAIGAIIVARAVRSKALSDEVLNAARALQRG
ncbi:MAG: TetR family transcriptional regulator [Hydrocarboniphaga sp.]|uniref:TetR/AcrR family transcriptional regulator n=1 Tax=Hydrocarboniphaga sp. TaxID=2033016 RepID=UPI00262BAF40|nr:TetR/AcrR family transcriptional regulator [Hydrocarboniphaga sp.]MDB5972008.1 TetR family transcriptional regulator [Hydrocarboniphaga sp.]